MAPTTDTNPLDLGRRRALGLLAGAGVATLAAACGSYSDGGAAAAGAGDTTSTTAAATTATTATTAVTSTGGTVSVAGAIPEETAGPYPADGTNGPNVLTESGIVRSDITTSFGSYAGVAAGVPLTVALTIVDAGASVAMPGAAVYLWHCDRDGHYSLYTAADENYLRGVQVADETGLVTFESIFPAAYDGRWPHIHFEIFGSVDEATNGRNALRITQLALPEAVCDEVYANVAGYESSVSNLDRTSLASDMVFSDGVDLQLAMVTGSNAGGYTASLLVGI